MSYTQPSRCTCRQLDERARPCDDCWSRSQIELVPVYTSDQQPRQGGARETEFISEPMFIDTLFNTPGFLKFTRHQTAQRPEDQWRDVDRPTARSQAQSKHSGSSGLVNPSTTRTVASSSSGRSSRRAPSLQQGPYQTSEVPTQYAVQEVTPQNLYAGQQDQPSISPQRSAVISGRRQRSLGTPDSLDWSQENETSMVRTPESQESAQYELRAPEWADSQAQPRHGGHRRSGRRRSRSGRPRDPGC